MPPSTSSPAPSNAATEREVQSALYRLHTMLESSGRALHGPLPPLVLPASTGADYALPNTTAQLRKDLLTLFALVKKAATQFSLAVRPESTGKGKSQAPPPSSSSSLSPLAGLSASSYAMAKTQLETLTADLLPKLVYLTQKARQEASVYVRVEPPSTSSPSKDQEAEGSAAPTAAQEEERKNMEALAQQLGGVVMTGSQLGLTTSGPRIRRRVGGHGSLWASSVVRSVRQLLDQLDAFAQAAMDEKTKTVMESAYDKLIDRRAAELAHDADVQEAVRGIRKDRQREREKKAKRDAVRKQTVEELRAILLEQTAAVWSLCDQATGGSSVPESEHSVLRQKLELQAQCARDAVEETGVAVEKAEAMLAKGEDGAGEQAAGEEEDGAEDDNDDEWDAFDGLNNVPMPAASLPLARRLLPFMRVGSLFLAKYTEVLQRDKYRADVEAESELEEAEQEPDDPQAEATSRQEQIARNAEQMVITMEELLHKLIFPDGDGDSDDWSPFDEDEEEDGEDAEDTTLAAEYKEWLKEDSRFSLETGCWDFAQAASDLLRLAGLPSSSSTDKSDNGLKLSKEFLDALQPLQKYTEEIQRIYDGLDKEGLLVEHDGQEEE